MSIFTAQFAIETTLPFTVTAQVEPIEFQTARGNTAHIVIPFKHTEGPPTKLGEHAYTIQLTIRGEAQFPAHVEQQVPDFLKQDAVVGLLQDGTDAFCRLLETFQSTVLNTDFSTYMVDDLVKHPLVRAYTVRFLKDGKQLHKLSSRFGIAHHPMNATEWQGIRDALISGTRPTVFMLLYLDAEAYLKRHDLKRAVLFMAMTVEVFVKQFIAGIGGTVDLLYPMLIDRQWEVSVNELVQRVLPLLTNDKYAMPFDYTDLKHLIEARNKLAHTGELFYTTNSGNRVDVDLEEVHKMFIAGRRLIASLRKLDTKNILS